MYDTDVLTDEERTVLADVLQTQAIVVALNEVLPDIRQARLQTLIGIAKKSGLTVLGDPLDASGLEFRA